MFFSEDGLVVVGGVGGVGRHGSNGFHSHVFPMAIPLAFARCNGIGLSTTMTAGRLYCRLAWRIITKQFVEAVRG